MGGVDGASELIPPDVAAMYSEYCYRKVFPSTSHDEYDAMPYSRVQWMLHIHRVVTETENGGH